MTPIRTKGRVSSGKGIGHDFILMPWVRKQIMEKFGFDPFPGTLNILLSQREAFTLKKILSANSDFRIIPARAHFWASCFKVRLMNYILGALIIPEAPEYPKNLFEIIAPINLRKTLSLADNDVVDIEIFT